jgi:aminomethyltransferase
MLKTPLDKLHRELGAKMVPFAGYDMPVQYPTGIIREHQHTRAQAGLFDVSHMGQVILKGPGVTQALESLVPVDLVGLNQHQQSYALFTNERGGVLDDLIITRWGEDEFFLVVNAACKEQDIAHLRQGVGEAAVTIMGERGLLALQGPAARRVIDRLLPAAAGLTFMSGMHAQLAGTDVYITCSGYTGEDGFEISMPADSADQIARLLLEQEEVWPIGLGARDSLRLEAGLSLYGHELSQDITPVEACLMWSVSKARRLDGARAGGFPGAERIFAQQAQGPARKRVGLLVEGKRPVRDGQAVLDAQGNTIGVVTSAAYGATLEKPVALAMVDTEFAGIDSTLGVDARGKTLPVIVCKTPFVPQRYFRG